MRRPTPSWPPVTDSSRECVRHAFGSSHAEHAYHASSREHSRSSEVDHRSPTGRLPLSRFDDESITTWRRWVSEDSPIRRYGNDSPRRILVRNPKLVASAPMRLGPTAAQALVRGRKWRSSVKPQGLVGECGHDPDNMSDTTYVVKSAEPSAAGRVDAAMSASTAWDGTRVTRSESRTAGKRPSSIHR